MPRAEEILTPAALHFVGPASSVRRPPGRAPVGPRPPPGQASRTGRLDFLPETAASPGGRLDGRVGAGRSARPAGGDHRAPRAEDGDQRAELRRPGLAGRPRGRQHPALAQRRRRPARAARRHPRHPAVRFAAGQAVPAAPPTVDWPRSSPGPAAGTSTSGDLLVDGTPAVGALVDFGLYFFHNAAELLARGSGPYFYLPKMESHLEARLWNDVFTHAQADARHPAWHRPGHRADRDHPGGLRDGRDPLRAAGSRVRAECRPVGLPVQRHQVLPGRGRRRSSCPTGAASP